MATPFAARRRRWILILSAAGLSAYSAYRIYHLPSFSTKRRKLVKLFASLVSLAEAVSSSTEAFSLVSSDLNQFLRSDSDEIPLSLKQLSKIARSDEFSSSISKISDAITVGIIRGYNSPATESQSNPSFSVKLIDKLFSDKGSGFASVVVGSFARNMVMAFYCRGEGVGSSDAPGWVNLLCSDKCMKLIGNNIEIFVRTAVSVYLEKTMELNTYEDLFSGLTNPRHEAQVKDILVSVCNGAVETLVKTSHRVLSSSTTSSSMNIGKDNIRKLCSSQNVMGSDDINMKDSSGLVKQVSSVFAVPSNRQFVLDVTGRVTFESIRSFLKFLNWKLQDGIKGSVNAVNEKVLERGMDVMRYLSAKALFSFTICIALCIRIAAGPAVILAA